MHNAIYTIPALVHAISLSCSMPRQNDLVAAIEGGLAVIERCFDAYGGTGAKRQLKTAQENLARGAGVWAACSPEHSPDLNNFSTAFTVGDGQTGGAFITARDPFFSYDAGFQQLVMAHEWLHLVPGFNNRNFVVHDLPEGRAQDRIYACTDLCHSLVVTNHNKRFAPLTEVRCNLCIHGGDSDGNPYGQSAACAQFRDSPRPTAQSRLARGSNGGSRPSAAVARP